MNKQMFKSLLVNHEGLRYHVYPDKMSNPTVGVGLNLNAPGAAEMLTQVGADAALVRSGKQNLNDVQIQALLDMTLDVAIEGATEVFTSQFAHLPDSVQAVVVDLVFNMGLPRFLGFKKFIAAVSREDFRTAANELRLSVWYGEVGQRAKDDIALLQEAHDLAQ